VDEEAPGEVVGEPLVGANVDLLPAERICVRAGVAELPFLDGEHDQRALPQVERYRALVLEPPVQGESLVQELVDPGSRIAEQEAPVASGGPRADALAVDDEDALARLCEETRRRAAGDAGSDDDGVRGA
jgi:hypothetical protein